MRFSELDGARIGAWGAGREIRALARALREQLPEARLAVVATDAPPSDEERAALEGVRFVTGAEIGPALAACDVVVRSPGVSIYRPELQALRVPVTTSTSLWLAEAGGAAVIGVTGTKGKSTTATLLAHLLRAAGRRVELAGNVGVPALELLDRAPAEHYVLELSSYQIADLATGPRIAVITNLFREHVDWHGGEEAYRRDKLRIASLPGVEQVIAPPDVLGVLPDAGPAWVPYAVPDGFHVDRGTVRDGRAPVAALAALPLRGAHNALNLCAALSAVRAAGVPVPPLPDALRDFRTLPHRLETVAERDGVLWVDDSISTTPESALAALATFADRRVLLIAGGHERDQDYAELARELAARGAEVFGLPTTGARLVGAVRAAGGQAREAPDLEAAMAAAAAAARAGDVVLLSPAAPSFGAYRSFEERGDHFRRLAAAQPPAPVD